MRAYLVYLCEYFHDANNLLFDATINNEKEIESE